MRDLKQCLLDLLRSGSGANSPQGHPKSSKPKKLHEYSAADCNAAFLRKYHELGVGMGKVPNGNIIYFNENLSMASKYDMSHFPALTRYPSCPLSSLSLSEDSVSPPQSSNSTRSQSGQYEFSSTSEEDVMHATQAPSSHLPRAAAKMHYLSHATPGRDEEMLDSFCTLCTSTFSYNKCCRYCENSICGSKCNSENGSRSSGSAVSARDGLRYAQQANGYMAGDVR